jgi:hypothetical protein
MPDVVGIVSPVAGRYKMLFRLPEGTAPLRTVLPCKGLEFRCAAGTGKTVQDVLPPSPHPRGGVYQWCNGTHGTWDHLPDLPPELLALWVHQLGAPAHQNGAELPADYPPPLGLERDEVEALLRKIDPDVSYPEWIKVGQALQHERPDDGLELWIGWSCGGSKYPGAEALREKWEGFGHAARPVTMRSIIRDYASAADVSEFELIEDPLEAELEETGLLPLPSFRRGPSMKWLIRNLLPAAGLGVIYGQPGSGKSFLAIDMAGAVARGLQWNERKVRKGRVVYIAAEGVPGLRKRAAAYQEGHSVPDGELMDFLFMAHPINLLTDDWKAFSKIVKKSGGADLIVIDTLAQSMPGGDENSSEDVGKIIEHCRQLHEATGAFVLLVHHVGKDTTKGARGWSGLRGAVDVELVVERDEDYREFRIGKSKDSDDEGRYGFKLRLVDLGHDEEGLPVDSCVVEYVEAADTTRKMTGLEAMVLEVVDSMLDLCNGVAAVTQVVNEAAKNIPRDQDAKTDNRKRDVRRALTKLRERGIIELDSDTDTVRKP